MSTADLAAKHDKHCSLEALEAFAAHFCADCAADDRAAFDEATELVLRHGPGRLLQAALAGCALTLNHGDIHPGNLMVRADAELRFVDFGDIVWTSPAYDVQQCLTCCLEPNVRRAEEAALLRVYSAEMRRLQPSWDDEAFSLAVRSLGALSCMQIAAWFGAEKRRRQGDGGTGGDLLDGTAQPLARRLVAMVADGARALQQLAQGLTAGDA